MRSLSLAVLGGALGSPGRAGGPDIFHRGREGQVGRVGPELWLQVVASMVVVGVMVVGGMVGGGMVGVVAVHLD